MGTLVSFSFYCLSFLIYPMTISSTLCSTRKRTISSLFLSTAKWMGTIYLLSHAFLPSWSKFLLRILSSCLARMYLITFSRSCMAATCTALRPCSFFSSRFSLLQFISILTITKLQHHANKVIKIIKTLAVLFTYEPLKTTRWNKLAPLSSIGKFKFASMPPRSTNRA